LNGTYRGVNYEISADSGEIGPDGARLVATVYFDTATKDTKHCDTLAQAHKEAKQLIDDNPPADYDAEEDDTFICKRSGKTEHIDNGFLVPNVGMVSDKHMTKEDWRAWEKHNAQHNPDSYSQEKLKELGFEADMSDCPDCGGNMGGGGCYGCGYGMESQAWLQLFGADVVQDVKDFDVVGTAQDVVGKTGLKIPTGVASLAVVWIAYMTGKRYGN
jgi:hypothetical protein